MATPSKRTRITNQTKEDIKKDSKKPGFKIEDAMKKHGLGMSTLYRILKEEPKTQSSRDDAKCVKGVTVPHAELEKRLIQWVVRTEKSGVMVDGNFIKGRAAAIADELHIKDLKFSNGWLVGFKKRHDLLYKKAHGEKKSADSHAAEEWITTEWPKLKQQYKLKDIYNTDETGIFFRGEYDSIMVQLWFCRQMTFSI